MIIFLLKNLIFYFCMNFEFMSQKSINTTKIVPNLTKKIIHWKKCRSWNLLAMILLRKELFFIYSSVETRGLSWHTLLLLNTTAIGITSFSVGLYLQDFSNYVMFLHYLRLTFICSHHMLYKWNQCRSSEWYEWYVIFFNPIGVMLRQHIIVDST